MANARPTFDQTNLNGGWQACSYVILYWLHALSVCVSFRFVSFLKMSFQTGRPSLSNAEDQL